jgi:hypothetical protein
LAFGAVAIYEKGTPPMRKPALLLLAAIVTTALVSALSSCDHRRYEIVMSSHDGVLDRTLAVTRVGESNVTLPDDEVAAIGKLYQKTEANVNGREVVFTGKFGGRTPNDIGGAGFHVFIGSPAGGVTAYVERFRGSDDLLDQMETRTKAADRMVDLVSGWLKTRVGGEKDFDKLQAFLDKDARRDLKNVSLYLWMMANDLVRAENAPREPLAAFSPVAASQPGGAASAPAGSQPAAVAAAPATSQPAEQVQAATPDKAHADVIARMALYLGERDYLLPKDTVAARKAGEYLPGMVPGPMGAFAKAAMGSDPERAEALVALAERVLTEKADITNKTLLKKIGGLWTADREASEGSLRQYLRQTDEYKKTLATWKAEPNKEPNAPEPDSMDVLSDLALSCINGPIGPDENDELTIALVCPVAPLYTNGVKGTAGQDPNCLYWSRIIPRAGSPHRLLPAVCYAVWAAPNEAFQKKHFGDEVLVGEHLAQYCLWRQGLSAEEAAQWDAMVATLTPSPKLVETVNAFQFSAPPKMTTAPATQSQPVESASDHSQTGKNLILNAMQGSPATQPAGAGQK